MRYYIIALFVFVIDQLSKLAVVRFMDLNETIPIWKGVFQITSHRNAGAAFGILQNQRAFFIVITSIVMIGIIVYLTKIRHKPLTATAMALILGGAAGNFLDRILKGEVVDFFYFILIDYPIFNVADSAIVIGVGLMILDTFLEWRREKVDKSPVV